MSRDEPALFAGRIHGVRSWRLEWIGGQPRLRGLTANPSWEPGGAATEARCTATENRRSHEAPMADCSCGLYAIHPIADATHDYSWALDRSGPDSVVGIVEAWGRVEVHRGGFRAEYARPVALCLGSDPRVSDRGQELAQVAECYGAELLDVADLEQLVEVCAERGYGLSADVVADLVPEREDEVVGEAGHRPTPTRSNLNRALEILGAVAVGLLGLLWYGTCAVIGVLAAIGFVRGLVEESPPRFTSAHLRIVDQRLVSNGRDLLYIAVVENTSEKRSAVNVFARGTVEAVGGETAMRLDRHGEFEWRSSLLPGERGVVIDEQRLPRGEERPRGLSYETTLVARRAKAGERRASIRIERARLAEDPCRVDAVLGSAPKLPALLAIVLRNERGGIAVAGFAGFGAVEGRNDRAAFEFGLGRRCPGSWESVDLHPRLLPAQVS